MKDVSQLTARGNRTRAKILRAAEDVFADVGYHEASIVKITDAAGIAQGTFYLYFESKKQVFDDVVEDLNHRVRQAMSEAAAQGGDRVEAERLGFAAFFRFTAEHPALYRIVRQAEFVSPEALRMHYTRIVDGYITGLDKARAGDEIADIDTTVAAWALMGIGELVGMRWVLWNPDGPQMPDEVFDEVMALINRALGATTPSHEEEQ